MLQTAIKFIQGVVLIILLLLIIGLLDFICNPLKYMHN